MTLRTDDAWAERIEALMREIIVRMGPPGGGGGNVGQSEAERWYSVKALAAIVGEAVFTIRQKCKLGQMRAEKCLTRCGPSSQWRISHAELVRYQREGNLPVDPHRNNPERPKAA